MTSLWIKAKKQAARAKTKPDKQNKTEHVAEDDVGTTGNGVPEAVTEQTTNEYYDDSAHLSLIFDGL